MNVGERRVFVTCGKGGRERIVPVSGRFFAALGEYLELERPAEATTDACFVVLKGPRRGLPLSPAGLDEVLDGARARAGLARCTCHQLRHTCLTRLREQGMALGGGAGAGRARVDRVHPDLSASRERLARARVSARRRRRSTRSSTRSPGRGGVVSRLARDPEVEALSPPIARISMAAGHVRGERGHLAGARRSCCASAARRAGRALSLEQQLAVSRRVRARLVTWLIVTGRVRPTAELPGRERLSAARQGRGVGAPRVPRAVHAGRRRARVRRQRSAELQWWAVAKVAAVAGVAPERLTSAQFDTASASS